MSPTQSSSASMCSPRWMARFYLRLPGLRRGIGGYRSNRDILRSTPRTIDCTPSNRVATFKSYRARPSRSWRTSAATRRPTASTLRYGEISRSIAIVAISGLSIAGTIGCWWYQPSITRSCSRSSLTITSCSAHHRSRSITTETVSSSPIPGTIEYKYDRRSMARSCSSSAARALCLDVSPIHKACASTTKVASSSPTPTTADCKHSRPEAVTSHRSAASLLCHGTWHSTSTEVSSPSRPTATFA